MTKWHRYDKKRQASHINHSTFSKLVEVVDNTHREQKSTEKAIDKSTDVVSPYVFRTHTTLFFLRAYLSPRHWLFSLQNRSKMLGEKIEREKFSERRRRGDHLRAKHTDTPIRAHTHSNFEAKFSFSFSTHPAPPIHPIFNSCFFSFL